MEKRLIKPRAIFSVFLIFCLVVISCNSSSEKTEEIPNVPSHEKTMQKITKQEAYNELLLRNRNIEKGVSVDTVPTNERLRVYRDKELYDVIYETDDRKNLYEITDPELIADAKKGGCILKKDQLIKNADGTFRIKPNGIYKSLYGLCDEETFANETVVAFCSGFAIDKNVFVTAGHCIKTTNLSNLVIVYGYAVDKAGSVNLTIRAEDIFQPVDIIARELDGVTKNDFCLLKINGRFQPERIARIRTEGKIADNEDVHVIGYPCGLPVKITPNGKVFNNSIGNYFVTNLDTYGGNSGSPVFNSKTHVVEGILVRGNDDFQTITVDKCRRSFYCPHDIGSCHGEDVSRISQFWKWIKK